MASSKPNANIVAFPDLPAGQTKGKRSDLMGAEIGTQFDWGQRLFAYYGEGDVFLLTVRLRRVGGS